jgi:hypothetical protein
LSPEPETGVDFFRHGALPVPVVTIEEAERMAKSFGLTVRAEPAGPVMVAVVFRGSMSSSLTPQRS